MSLRCIHTIAEYGAYAYATTSPDGGDAPQKRDAAEEPIKLHDHTMDATRYVIHSELAGAAKTEAYLAQMVALSQRPDEQKQETFR